MCQLGPPLNWGDTSSGVRDSSGCRGQQQQQEEELCWGLLLCQPPVSSTCHLLAPCRQPGYCGVQDGGLCVWHGIMAAE
jgi:hypothetical protein